MPASVSRPDVSGENARPWLVVGAASDLAAARPALEILAHTVRLEVVVLGDEVPDLAPSPRRQSHRGRPARPPLIRAKVLPAAVAFALQRRNPAIGGAVDRAGSVVALGSVAGRPRGVGRGLVTGRRRPGGRPARVGGSRRPARRGRANARGVTDPAADLSADSWRVCWAVEGLRRRGPRRGRRAASAGGPTPGPRRGTGGRDGYSSRSPGRRRHEGRVAQGPCSRPSTSRWPCETGGRWMRPSCTLPRPRR